MDNIKTSDDKTLLDVPKIHAFLSNDSTWAKGIGLATVDTAISNSICIGVYKQHEQVAFCRIITDCATFANLVDVIVWPEYRGMGIAKLLMTNAINHSAVQGIRRFTLATANAHGLYAQFGFSSLDKPDTFMQRYDPHIYEKTNG